jgi:phosphatidylglycerophosphatase A
VPDGATAAPAHITPFDRLALAIATVFGAGRSPFAPGTVASALTVIVLAVVPFSLVALIVFFVVVTLVGTWASHHAERVLGVKDASAIVIDEVAGMTLSVLLLPRTIPVLASAFVLFRIFDVVKPFPAWQSQRLPGGFGVMTDDLIAGLYALAILAGARALVGWPA